MAIYTITIDDTEEWGITAAREANNAARQPTIPDPENPGEEIPNPLIFADNASYMQFVMVRAVDSWLVHYPEANPDVQQNPVCTPAPAPAPAPAQG